MTVSGFKFIAQWGDFLWIFRAVTPQNRHMEVLPVRGLTYIQYYTKRAYQSSIIHKIMLYYYRIRSLCGTKFMLIEPVAQLIMLFTGVGKAFFVLK